MKQILLNWNKKLSSAAAEKLLESSSEDESFIDLSSILVIVTGREAIRKLLLKLTELSNLEGKGLIPPQIVSSSYILLPPECNSQILSDLERKLLLINILRESKLNNSMNLFPNLTNDTQKDITWLSSTADIIISTINKISENGLTVSSLVKNHEETLLNDIERWKELSDIEKIYKEELKKLGLSDPDYIKIENAESPSFLHPESYSKIISISVIDPIPLVKKALEQISKRTNVEVWIYTDENNINNFDKYGTPDIKFWSEHFIEIPDKENCRTIFEAPLPEDQGKRCATLISTIKTKNKELSYDDISLISPNKDLTPYIENELNKIGLETFDPSGIKLTKTRPYILIKNLLDSYIDPSYYNIASVIRNPDFLSYLKSETIDFSLIGVLKSFDLIQNKYKPDSLSELIHYVVKENQSISKYKIDCTELKYSLCKINDIIKELKESKNFWETLLSTINIIFSKSKHSFEKDSLFINTLEKITETINEYSKYRVHLRSGINESIFIFNEYIKNKEIYADYHLNKLQISGWLETLWSDSEYLIITCANENYVPTNDTPNLFLTETVKEKLGIRNNKTYFARDAYILNALLKSRASINNDNFVFFILGRWDINGDHLKPSRLFYLCDNDTLIARIKRLWQDYGNDINEQKNANNSEDYSYKLKTIRKQAPQNISISKIKVYLASPVIFYFRHVLQMEKIDDTNEGIDAAEFGTICHYAFETLISNYKESIIPDIDHIRKILIESTDKFVRDKYGNNLSLSFLIAIDSIKSRLNKAAEHYLEDYLQGWRTLEAEYSMELLITETKLQKWLNNSNIKLKRNYILKGKIDRVDQNINTRKLRIIDYKTSDSEKNPESAHIKSITKPENFKGMEYLLFDHNGKKYRWLDLQLPLYCIMLMEQKDFKGKELTCGYFNLPSSTDKSGIKEWTEINEFLETAKKTTAKIIKRMDDGNYYPIGNIQSYDNDDFKRLFNKNPEFYFDFTNLSVNNNN